MKNKLEAIRFINQQKNIYQTETFVYELSHKYDATHRPVMIKSNLNSKTMNLLVAYLHFKSFDIECTFDFDQIDMADVLVKYFKCEVVDSHTGSYTVIDLFENWEQWEEYSKSIKGINHFNIQGLTNELKNLIEAA